MIKHLLKAGKTAANFAVIRMLSAVGRGLARQDGEERRSRSGTEPHGFSKRIRRIGLWFGLFLLVLGLFGAIVVVSGIVPIKASSGHWAITAWFLNFSMSRSVSTHSLGIDPPPLEDRALLLKGAAHYESGCSPCHGNPELPHPRIPLHMTPHPPYLPKVLSQWDAAELFYIVKHGVKFTGMPAWPAQERDDEVWAMVGFLRRFPELNAEEYRKLAYGELAGSGQHNGIAHWGRVREPDVPGLIREHCARCHGADGLGRGTGAFPVLAGQRLNYMFNALQAFARGTRHSGVMEPIAAGLSTADMAAVAEYYSQIESRMRPLQTRAPDDAIERGAKIARAGIPSQRVPACADCHGPSPVRRNPNYPLLSGQYSDYLLLQLQLLKARKRGGSEYVDIMHPIAARLTEQQMRDVALYYSSLPMEPSRAHLPEPVEISR